MFDRLASPLFGHKKKKKLSIRCKIVNINIKLTQSLNSHALFIFFIDALLRFVCVKVRRINFDPESC